MGFANRFHPEREWPFTLPLGQRMYRYVSDEMVNVAACFNMFFLQMLLGISTLLYFVPIELAASHQAGSLTLLTGAMWLANELKRLPKI